MQKIRENDTSSLCLPQFDKFSINSAAHELTGEGNQVIFFSDETFNEKLMKSDQVKTYFWRVLSV